MDFKKYMAHAKENGHKKYSKPPSLLNLIDTDTVCRNNPYDNCTVINFRKDNLEL